MTIRHPSFRAVTAMLLASAWAMSCPGLAQAQHAGGQSAARVDVLRIPAGAELPVVKRMSLGVGKSVLVEFPMELHDVFVAAPDKVDAVVQSSNRVFLIGKGEGATNAFFFDSAGGQILLLEISVGTDIEALGGVLKRLVPGSAIRAEMAGKAVVLTGTVRSPLDAKHAADIACQFVAANRSAGQAAASLGPNSTSVNVTSQNPTSQGQYESKTQQQAAACGSDSKLVIDLLAVESEEQVMLTVSVAEVQRSLLKQFGVNLGASISAGNLNTNFLTENALPLTSAAGLGTLPVAGIGTQAASAGTAATCATAGVLCNYNAGSSGSFGNSGITTSFGGSSSKITTALRALERVGLLRTLAEPNLTAVSGETANFLAGGEYPIPVVDSQGQLSVTYKKFGIGLAFTPIVLSAGRISLKIESEVSELTNDGAVVLSNISIPALKTRQAKTTVELPSGGSLTIAGLISESTKQNIDGVPALKDADVLGTLFRSRDFIKSETELLVIVTVYMVHPTARANLGRPDDGFAPASDAKANFLGHLNRIVGKATTPPPGSLHGAFIVE